MSNVDQKLNERVTALITKGEGMQVTMPGPNVVSQGKYDHKIFNEWKSQSLAFLSSVFGEEHVYFKQFEKLVVHPYTSDGKAGCGILRAVKQDIEQGHLSELKTLVTAEVFTDFLEMAKHLLDQGYWRPSASLIGAVLEDGLRTIARNNGATVNPADDLGVLNGKCGQKGAYNSIVSKQVALWTDVRNKADHGNFDQFKEADVRDMHGGVSRFLAEHLK